MKREYYQDIEYKPFLFFIIFGVSGDQLEVSKKKHKVDELPEALDIRTLTRAENGDYIDGFFTESFGNVLKSKDDSIFERCRTAEKCVVLQGESLKQIGSG